VTNISFYLNGRFIELETRSNTILLDLLRDNLGIKSVKKGCELGECGACTVLLEGLPVKSCLLLVPQIQGQKITTLEGLSDDPMMKKLIDAYIANGSVQCGFCTPGMLISSYALLRKNSHPDEEEVKKGIEGNLCRCTGYVNIVKAIMDASERLNFE
jgi:carbon-monoxide dehydrogenase small subunit